MQWWSRTLRTGLVLAWLPTLLATRTFTGIRGSRKTPAATQESWGYIDHGASWASIGQCGDLASQSPINVSQAAHGMQENVMLFYRFAPYMAPVTIHNDGHVLEVPFPRDAGNIAVGPNYLQATATYAIERIVIHVPSEHTFQGGLADLELQLWHRGEKDSIGVVAVGFKRSRGSSEMLKALSRHGLPDHTNGSTLANIEDKSLNFGELFGPRGTGGVVTVGATKAAFLQYEGSTTTPPCSSGVQWFVRDGEPLPASNAEIDAFEAAIRAITSMSQTVPGNARALQDAGGRMAWVRIAEDAIQEPLPIFNETFQAELAESWAEARNLSTALGVVEDVSHDEQSDSDSPMAQSKSASVLCTEDLARSSEELVAAKARQKQKCDAETAARDSMASAGVGKERLSSATTLHAQEALCSQETSTVTALESDVQAQEARCDELTD